MNDDCWRGRGYCKDVYSKIVYGKRTITWTWKQSRESSGGHKKCGWDELIEFASRSFRALHFTTKHARIYKGASQTIKRIKTLD